MLGRVFLRRCRCNADVSTTRAWRFSSSRRLMTETEDSADQRQASSPLLVVSTREALVRTDFVPTIDSNNDCSHHPSCLVPLSLNDAYVLHEQLPYAYFFRERLDDIKLQQSLQKVLAAFPILGGQLSLDNLCIELRHDDTVPFSVGTTRTPAKEWLAMRHSGPRHLLPLFDPLPRDPWNSRTPLARIRVTHIDNANDHDDKDGSITKNAGVASAGGTVIAVNISHAAADGASAIHFMYCWGRQHRQLNYAKPSYLDRSLVTTNGMLTPNHAEILNLGRSNNNNNNNKDDSNIERQQHPSALGAFSSQVLGFSSSVILGALERSLLPATVLLPPSPSSSPPRTDTSSTFVLKEEEPPESVPTTTTTTTPQHEYVLLHFTPLLLSAMKVYGIAQCAAADAIDANANNDDNDDAIIITPTFVSTNDLVTAAGWTLMRELSGNHDWGMNVVVNIRGRAADAPNFANASSGGGGGGGTGTGGVQVGGGLFGNGITAATARAPSTTATATTTTTTTTTTDHASADEMARQTIFASAVACRTALQHLYKRLPEHMAASRTGHPVMRKAAGNAFCTTSWHFPLWEIDFEDHPAPDLESEVADDTAEQNKGGFIERTTGMACVEDDAEHGRPFAFHGQPVHPLPPGDTYAAVVVPTACQGLDYQLFLPLHQAKQAKRYIQHLEELFL